MAMIQQPDGSEEFRFAGMNMALVAVMIDRVVMRGSVKQKSVDQ